MEKKQNKTHEGQKEKTPIIWQSGAGQKSQKVRKRKMMMMIIIIIIATSLTVTEHTRRVM
jgi:hypothetical protein